MIFGTPFLPESPRWLIETNQIDKAVNCVKRLRVPRVDAERGVNDLYAAMKHQEDFAGGSSYMDLFKSKDGNLRRTLIVLSMGCLQQGQRMRASPPFTATTTRADVVEKEPAEHKETA